MCTNTHDVSSAWKKFYLSFVKSLRLVFEQNLSLNSGICFFHEKKSIKCRESSFVTSHFEDKRNFSPPKINFWICRSWFYHHSKYQRHFKKRLRCTRLFWSFSHKRKRRFLYSSNVLTYAPKSPFSLYLMRISLKLGIHFEPLGKPTPYPVMAYLKVKKRNKLNFGEAFYSNFRTRKLTLSGPIVPTWVHIFAFLNRV